MTSYFHFYGRQGPVTMRLCCLKDAYNILRHNRSLVYFRTARTKYHEHRLGDAANDVH